MFDGDGEWFTMFCSVLWCFVVFNYAFVAITWIVLKSVSDLVSWCSSRDATASKKSMSYIFRLNRSILLIYYFKPHNIFSVSACVVVAGMTVATLATWHSAATAPSTPHSTYPVWRPLPTSPQLISSVLTLYSSQEDTTQCHQWMSWTNWISVNLKIGWKCFGYVTVVLSKL